MKTTFTKTFALLLFIAQQHYSQNLQWVRGFGGSMGEESRSVITDGSGNVFTTGYFWGTVDFDPGPGTYTLSSSGNTDIFVQKLDASGNFVWAGHMGGFADDNGNSIAIDGTGNVFITGMFAGLADFDPSPSSAFSISSSGGSYEAFVVKLNNNGAFQWVKRMGSTGTEEGFGICTDAAGSVYTTGKFEGTVDFDPNSGTTNLTASGSSMDVFVQKLSNSGSFVWAKSVGGAAHDEGHKIAVDAAGNVFTTGQFEALVDFDPGLTTANLTSNGLEDVFILKLDVNGNYGWAKALGGAATDSGNSIDADGLGNIYTCGSYSGLVDFDPGVGTNNVLSNGLDDIFIIKLDPSGNLAWAKQMGSSLGDYGYSLYADASNVYMTGNFSGTVDFDPGAGTATLNASSGGGSFVQKLSAAGNYMWAINFSASDALAIHLDAGGMIYLTGMFGGTVDMDPGAGVTNLTSTGTTDNFVMKLNPLSLRIDVNRGRENIHIFPNPFSDKFYLDLNNDVSEFKIEVFNSLGKRVFESSTVDLNGIEIDAPPGLYFVCVTGSNVKEVAKIIKQ